MGYRKKNRFQTLKINDFCMFLKNECLNMDSKSIFQTVSAWISHNEDDRRKHFQSLIKFIKFSEMEGAFIDECVLSTGFIIKLIYEEPDTIMDCCLYLKQKILEYEMLSSCQQGSSVKADVIIAGGREAGRSSIVKYSTAQRQFLTCTEPPVPCVHAAVALHADSVYIIGGWESPRSIQVYRIETDSWSQMHCDVLQNGRVGARAAVIKSKLYVLAGHSPSNKDQIVQGVEVLDLSHDNDAEIAPINHDFSLPTLRDGFALVQNNDELIVTGGVNKSTTQSYDDNAISDRGISDDVITKTTNKNNRFINVSSRACDVICTASNTSRRMEPMLEGRYDHASAVFNNKIIVIGGICSNMSSVESYCFESKVWCVMPPMTIGRNGHCAAVVDNKLFVVGGGGTNSIEMLGSANKKWFWHQNIITPFKYCVCLPIINVQI